MADDIRKLREAADEAVRAVKAARAAGRYLFTAHQGIEIGGTPLDLTLHFADVSDRVVCVGVDLRSFVSKGDGGAVDEASVTPLTNWTEITTVLLRQLALGERVEFALKEQVPRTDNWQIVGSDDPERAAELGRAFVERVQAGADKPRRRGRKPLLDDDALARVVAPAYRTGGRKPVLAVQAALDRADVLPGAGPDGRVSIDQARKAVAAARARGFIPPAAPRKGGQQ